MSPRPAEPSGRAATRTRRPEARPTEILDAALAVFAARGYRATTLEEIAERAGVSKGAIYHYHATKDALLVAAVQQRLRLLLAPMAHAALDGGRGHASVAARLHELLAPLWSYWCRPEWAGVFGLLVGELRTDFPELAEAWLANGPVRGWGLLETLLETGRTSGELRADLDAPVAARFIVQGLMLQAVLVAHLAPPAEADDRAAFLARTFAGTLDVLLHGVLRPSGGVPPAPVAAGEPPAGTAPGGPGRARGRGRRPASRPVREAPAE